MPIPLNPTHCKGCGTKLNDNMAMNSVSRYDHGYICSDCGQSEAFHGDFITRYHHKDNENNGVYPLDHLLANNITA